MLAFDRFSEWDVGTQKHVKSTSYTSEVRAPEDKYRVGAKLTMIETSGRAMEGEITESVSEKRLVARMASGNLSGLVALELEPVGEGTRFMYSMEYEMPWGVLGKLMDGLFARRMSEKEIQGSLENVKRILEK